jgi:hypothetical protein
MIVLGLWLGIIGYAVLYSGVAKLGGDATCTLGNALRGKCKPASIRKTSTGSTMGAAQLAAARGQQSAIPDAALFAGEFGSPLPDAGSAVSGGLTPEQAAALGVTATPVAYTAAAPLASPLAPNQLPGGYWRPDVTSPPAQVIRPTSSAPTAPPPPAVGGVATTKIRPRLRTLRLTRRG